MIIASTIAAHVALDVTDFSLLNMNIPIGIRVNTGQSASAVTLSSINRVSLRGTEAMTNEEARKELSQVCYSLGCSGLSRECPGNARCGILQKIFKATVQTRQKAPNGN